MRICTFLFALFITTSLLLFSGCRNQPSAPRKFGFISGGPCTYTTTAFEATISSIRQVQAPDIDHHTDTYEVELRFSDGASSKKPQLLNDLIDIPVDSTFLAKNGYEPGAPVTGKVHKITKGTCTPRIYEIDLK